MIDEFIDEIQSLPDNKLQLLVSNIDKAMMITQKKLEDAITAYGLASDELARLTKEYRVKRMEKTRAHMSKGEKVTVIGDITKGETATEKEKLMKAEGDLKKCQFFVMAFENRLNTIKYIGKKTDNLIKG